MKELTFKKYENCRLNLTVFKSSQPLSFFDPNKDNEFEKYIIIDEGDDWIILSSRFTFTHLESDKCIKLNKEDLKSNFYWVL